MAVKVTGPSTTGVDIYDQTGNKVGNVPYGENGIKGTGETIYRSSDGGFTTDRLNTGSFSYDLSTGRIDIVVPDEIKNSDWFKDNYTENSTFRQVAEMFASNPGDKTGYSFYDKDGNVTEKTVADWLKEQKKAFDEAYKTYTENLLPRKENLSVLTGGQAFSDNQAIIAASATSRDKNKFSTDVTVYLPNIALTVAPELKKLASWNETTQTVNAKDFYEWYTLNDKPKDMSDKVSTVNATIDDLIIMLAQKEDMTEYDKDELVRLISFRNTLKNDRPDANILIGTGMATLSATNAFLNNLTEAGFSLTSFLQTAFTGVGEVTNVNTTTGKILAIATGGVSALAGATASFGAATIQSGAVVATDFGEMIAGVDNNLDEKNGAVSVMVLGDIVNGIANNTVRETLEKWAEATDTPLNTEAITSVEKIYNEKMDALEQLSGAASIGKVVGNFAAEVVKQIALTNVVGGFVGKFVKGGLQGAATAMEAGLTAYAGTMGAKQLTGVLSAANKSAGFIGFASNVFAQGVVDTILNDESSIEKMLTEGDTREAFGAVAKNSAYNLFGELTGLGTEKAVTAFKGSKTGHMVQTASWRIANQAAGVKHTILGNFANWVADGSGRVSKVLDSVFKASDETSRWYAALHWQEAEAAFNIATAAKGLSGEEAYEATAKAVVDRMALEVDMGNVTRGTMRRFNEIISNEAISKEYGEFEDVYAALVKEEGAKAVKIGDGTFISQDTSDYIARLSKIKYLEAKEGASELGALSKTEAEYLSMLRTRVADFEASHTAELVARAKETLSKMEQYEYAYMNFATKSYEKGGLGLYDEDTVMGWRGTKFWGANGEQYVPLVKIEGKEATLDTARRALANWENGEGYQAKISIDEYSYKPGDADAHYLDPHLTIYTQQVTAAKVANARDWGGSLMKNDSLAKEIDTEGNYVTKTELKRAKREAKNSVEEIMRDYDRYDDVLAFPFVEDFKRGTERAVASGEKRILRSLGLSTDGGYQRAAFQMDATDMENLRALDVKVPVVSEVSTDAEAQAYFDSLPKPEKNAVTKALGTEKLTADSFNRALRETTMAEKIQQQWLSRYLSMSEVLKDENEDIVKGYIMLRKSQVLDAEGALKLDNAFADYSDATKQLGLKAKGRDDFTKDVSTMLNEMMDIVEKSLSETPFFRSAVKRYTEAGISEDAAKHYLVASEFKEYLTGSSSKKALNAMLDKNLNSISTSGNITTGSKMKYKKAIKDALKELAESEWATSVKALNSAGGESLIDTNEVYNYVYEQMSDFIDTTVKSRNVIQVLDANGKFHLYEVSPATATLYKTRPNPGAYRQRGLTKFFNKTNRLARLGNVGFSLRSFTNQWVRDPLNAYVAGGMVRTISQRSSALGDLLGPSTVEVMQETMGEAGWKSFMDDLAESVGEDLTNSELTWLAKIKVSGPTELERMATEALGGTETETAFYRRQATGVRDLVWGELEQSQSAMEKALKKLESHSIGETRELYLRKAVFANSYSDALQLGHTTQEAKIIAEYTMQNATTNFSRAFAWGNRITSSVSFLSAAINGRASFWRLFEVDPVGISMRFWNGLAIPVMALVSQSLQSETDKAVYENIPEYEKEDNLVFVVNGQKMKIPIPQELSMFVAPFRHAVEKAHDANRHAWAELIANDILATSAIDLTGFVDLDRNLLEGDATLADRLSSEAQALVSQLSPTVVKTAYMALTGTDPYTGNPIDTSSVYLDENDQLTILDSKSSAFTSWLSKMLKGMGVELSGSAAHALLKTMLGNGFSNTIDAVSDLFSGNPESLYETPLKEMTSAFVPSSSNDSAQYAWNQVVKSLKAEKTKLLASNGALTKVSNALSQLDSSASDYQTKRQELLRQYYEITQDYQRKVYTAVKNLQSKYGAEYDRSKFAATINLLNFYTPTGDNLTEYEKNLNSEQYFAARAQAIRTMAQYGFDSPNDLSIFGYLKTNAYGDAEVKAYDPLVILNQGNEVWGAKDIDSANIQAELEQAGLTRKEMFGDAYYTAKSKGKSALKQYKADWNTKVVKALAPYIQSRGVDNVLSNYATRDLLDNYIFVDNPYKTQQYLYKIFGEQ